MRSTAPGLKRTALPALLLAVAAAAAQSPARWCIAATPDALASRPAAPATAFAAADSAAPVGSPTATGAETPKVAPGRSAVTPAAARKRAAAAALVYSAAIFIVVLFAMWALRRYLVRSRAALLRQPRPATPSDDVWSMHKPPSEWEDGPGG